MTDHQRIEQQIADLQELAIAQPGPNDEMGMVGFAATWAAATMFIINEESKAIHQQARAEIVQTLQSITSTAVHISWQISIGPALNFYFHKHCFVTNPPRFYNEAKDIPASGIAPHIECAHCGELIQNPERSLYVGLRERRPEP